MPCRFEAHAVTRSGFAAGEFLPVPVYLVYLVYLVCLVYFVYLVYLVYLVDLVPLICCVFLDRRGAFVDLATNEIDQTD